MSGLGWWTHTLGKEWVQETGDNKSTKKTSQCIYTYTVWKRFNSSRIMMTFLKIFWRFWFTFLCIYLKNIFLLTVSSLTGWSVTSYCLIFRLKNQIFNNRIFFPSSSQLNVYYNRNISSLMHVIIQHVITFKPFTNNAKAVIFINEWRIIFHSNFLILNPKTNMLI